MPQQSTTRAFYNADCPVCNSEMCHYSAYSKSKALPIVFEDLNRTDLEKWGLTEDKATRLLHVIHRDQMHVGFDAILVLWEQMPRYRIPARIARLPWVYHLLDWVYANVVARFIYHRHQQRKARGLVP